MKYEKEKNFIILFLSGFLCITCIGYLFINRSNIVEEDKWSIYFDNTSLSEAIIEGKEKSNYIKTNIESNIFTVSARLGNPSDSIMYNIDIKNDGNIDAYVESIYLTINGMPKANPIDNYFANNDLSMNILNLDKNTIIEKGTKKTITIVKMLI